MGFPGGSVVKNLPANVGDTGSIPGLGRSHLLGSSWCVHHNSWALALSSLCSASREASALQLKSSPCSLQWEKKPVEQWRPSLAKNKYINKNLKKPKSLKYNKSWQSQDAYFVWDPILYAWLGGMNILMKQIFRVGWRCFHSGDCLSSLRLPTSVLGCRLAAFCSS